MIHITDITKRYGDRVLYKNASLQILAGEKIGLVGPNGAGKTTVFRLITGEEHPDEGHVNIGGDTVVGYFSQSVGDMRGRSILEEVKAGAGYISVLANKIDEMEKKLETLAMDPAKATELEKLMEAYGEAQSEFIQRDGYNLDARARANLTGLGFEPDTHNMAVESFSGGWKMRVALAKILTLEPDVLLMDEPTNHLDIESIIWLEEWLKQYKGGLIMTSHDREFMNRLVGKILEIANGNITTYPGNYDYYLREREVRREQLQAAFTRQQEMLAKEEEFIARFGARASHAAQVQSRVKKLDKIERIEIPSESKTVYFKFAPPVRTGNDVIRFEGLAKTWIKTDGQPKKIFEGVSGVVRRLNKIAVTGVNGAGKSTFLKVITSQTEPNSGVFELGANVKLGYFSQHSQDLLQPQLTVEETLTQKLPQLGIGAIRSLLGAFLFSGDDIYKKISQLSGGEKSRVVLACILASQANLLILDEPTNHLDIDTRETLLKALQEFEGTLLIVSHDRHFLKHLTNRTFEINQGAMHIYEGSYDDYIRYKR